MASADPLVGAANLVGAVNLHGAMTLHGAMDLLGAAPGWAHDGHSAAFTGWDAVVVRCLVVAATTVVAGVALLQPFTGAVNTATRRLVYAAAGAAVTGILQTAAAGRAPWWLAIAQALITGAVAGTLHRPVIATAGGLVLTAVTAVESMTGHGWIDVAAGIGHAGSGAVCVAAAVVIVAADTGTRRTLLRRLAPVAVCGGVLVTATGLVLAWLDGLRVDPTTAESAFGRVVALKAALVVGVAGIGLLGYRRLGYRRLGPLGSRALVTARVSATALVGALVAGAGLAAVAAPPAPPVPGVPLLRSAVAGEVLLPVVVVPQRPGWNLVHVGADGTMVGVDRGHLVPATSRPGGAGGWALVKLPIGQSRLWIRHDGRLASLRVDAGRAAVPATTVTGPDGPECVSAVLGGLVAGRDVMPAACPADRLSDEDAASLNALVTYLAGRGVRAVAVLDDPSPRSRAASQVVRAAAARHRLTVASGLEADSAVIVVSGWSVADATLRGVAGGELPGLGTYLAPWLANARLLAHPSGAVVALRYDPRDPQPLRYAGAVRSRFGGEPATAAGYQAWRTVTGAAAAGRTHLYAAATISLLPAELAHDHGVPGGWLPGGTITRVTPPLED